MARTFEEMKELIGYQLADIGGEDIFTLFNGIMKQDKMDLFFDICLGSYTLGVCDGIHKERQRRKGLKEA